MTIDITFVLASLGIGLVAGLLGGMLGIGGGIIIVPALVWLLDSRLGGDVSWVTQIAVATSLCTIIFTSMAAARAQIRRQSVRWDIVKGWTPLLLIGSFASGFLLDWVPAGVLRIFIALFLLLVSAIMLANWSPSPNRQLPNRVGSACIATLGGLVSGAAGIGGGNVIVPTLVFFNVPMQMASGSASTMGVPIALAGTIGHVIAGWSVSGLPSPSLGYVYLTPAVVIIVTSMLTAPLGVALGHRLPAAKLKRIFGALLLLVALRMLYSGIS